MPEVEPTVQRSRAATGSGRNGQGYMGNESVPIQLAQCWFPGLAISNTKI